MTPAELRRLLPRTYYGFFGRHAMPRPIQLAAAPPLVAGRDALLLAPSASGKTEGYAAPLCERLLAGAWDAPAILIVTPTRALANDLRRRLEGPAASLGIKLGRWTGERKEPSGGRLPSVTILTPEALDARLSRSPASIRTVRCAVLDELHVLDGNTRGDQLRMLISRLRRIAGNLQVAAASATVADPEGMASRYLQNAAIACDPARARIRAAIVHGTSPLRVGEEIARLMREGARKFLLFANRRADVESYSAALARFPLFRGRVYAHHGSLSRRSRESAEEGFLRSPRALCVATMTLELGIDIGDVDVAGILAPPADVSGFLQRIGRSGRRGQGPRAILFARDEGDAFRYRTLLALARVGDLAADPPRFHPSVLVQQALSLLHQNPGAWISASAIRRRMDPALGSAWDEARIRRILDSMAKHGWLENAGRGRYVEGGESESKWERGLLHSNISDRAELEVFDQLTGEVIGTVAAPPDDKRRRLRIAGRDRRIVFQGKRRIVVRDDAGGKAPIFAPRGVPLIDRKLAQAHARRLGLAEEEWPLLSTGSGTSLFHFLGTAGGEVLGAALAGGAAVPVEAAGPFALLLACSHIESIPAVGLRELEILCRERRERLARILGMGPYHRFLPQEEADRALFEAADLSGLVEIIARARIVEPPAGASRKVLEDLG